MTTKGGNELDFIFHPLTGRQFHFNIAAVRLLHVFGLGLPRMSTKEEVVSERGVYEHGSTPVLLKLPPAREWGFDIEVAGVATRQQYWDIRNEFLIAAFNPAESTDCGFDSPVPIRYTKVLPNGERRHLDFFYRSGLEFNEPPTDGTHTTLRVRCVSPDVTLYGDLEEYEFDPATYLVDVNGTVLVRPGEDLIRFIGDSAVDVNWVKNLASWCACPKITFTIDPNGRADYRLGAIVYENLTDNNRISRFIPVTPLTPPPPPVPTPFWGPFTFTGFGEEKIIFDVCNRLLIRQSQATADPLDIVEEELQLSANEQMDWVDFNLVQRDTYVFGIDFIDESPAANVRIDNIELEYEPRYIGI